ncbi:MULTISPECIES: dienelactone hydrolase family protein [Pseudomonas]|uniref:dienelactone hydrolase family protein n=1 Tax=Pseudomonas TaxID=286 RepID=UPI0007620A45|nr:prolyl oligopeptidase family serine peptidase [Pseudomonas monteilii]QIG26694.1 prolyl oligopeptidase family serine peptidase [Pseudomonas monteilii]
MKLAGVELLADVREPANARALVIFAHGSGSGRLSARNQYVADVLAARGLGSLLFDLLTEAEQRLDNETGELRFDIALLAKRLIDVIDWVASDPQLGTLRIGLFGASTGAAAALWAAAQRPERVAAVVSRGGRTDLAGPMLDRVQAPTLHIVGSRDALVLELNRQVDRLLGCERHLEVVPGATHLFEEPGTLAKAAALAGDWFVKYLQ